MTSGVVGTGSVLRGAVTPRWLYPLATIAAALIALPLLGIFARIEWSGFWGRVTSPEALAALGLSFRTASISTALCLALGVPLGVALHRMTWRGTSVLRAIVLTPLVLPPVVGGLALLFAFGRRGLLGEHLEVLGVSIAFTTTAVVIAQTFVAMPFTVFAVESALASRGDRHDAIAATLGASPTRVFTHVTLPALIPALVMGGVLAFARALGEFGATLTFAGSLQGVTRTGPLLIYLSRETDQQTAVALGLVLLVVAITVVALAFRPLSRAL